MSLPIVRNRPKLYIHDPNVPGSHVPTGPTASRARPLTVPSRNVLNADHISLGPEVLHRVEAEDPQKSGKAKELMAKHPERGYWQCKNNLGRRQVERGVSA